MAHIFDFLDPRGARGTYPLPLKVALSLQCPHLSGSPLEFHGGASQHSDNSSLGILHLLFDMVAIQRSPLTLYAMRSCSMLLSMTVTHTGARASVEAGLMLLCLPLGGYPKITYWLIYPSMP